SGLFELLKRDDELRQMMISIGLPALTPDGRSLIRGPHLRIPEVRSDVKEVAVTPENIDAWARKGWVDLRVSNMQRWLERVRKMKPAHAQVGNSSGDFTREAYLED